MGYLLARRQAMTPELWIVLRVLSLEGTGSWLEAQKTLKRANAQGFQHPIVGKDHMLMLLETNMYFK